MRGVSERVLLVVEREQRRGQRVARRHAQRDLLGDRIGLAAVASRPRSRPRCARSCRRCTGSCAGRPRGPGRGTIASRPSTSTAMRFGNERDETRYSAAFAPARVRPDRHDPTDVHALSLRLGSPSIIAGAAIARTRWRHHGRLPSRRGSLSTSTSLIDWDEYFTAAARATTSTSPPSARRCASVLETCAEICAAIEPEARAGWYEAGEARERRGRAARARAQRLREAARGGARQLRRARALRRLRAARVRSRT